MAMEGEAVPHNGDGRRQRHTTMKKVESLATDFEELGLSPYEARVLLALLKAGSANSTELARLSSVPRTSVYQVIQDLTAKALALRVAGEAPATWAAVGRDEVFERLESLQEEQLRRYREKAEAVKKALVAAWPEAAEPDVPYLQLIPSAARTKRLFDQHFAEAQQEILAFSRPPYSFPPGRPNKVVLDAAGRGVTIRALYEAPVLEDEANDALRADIDAYIRAGVEGRLVDRLPMKLVIFDRQVALVALTDGSDDDSGYPANLMVNHSGFASVQAEAFEVLWEQASPYDPKPNVARSRRRSR